MEIPGFPSRVPGRVSISLKKTRRFKNLEYATGSHQKPHRREKVPL
jgi:hypothetical protein